MAAAVAAGIYSSFDEAAERMVQVDRVVEPNNTHAALYEDLYRRYADLYQRLNVPPAS